MPRRSRLPTLRAAGEPGRRSQSRQRDCHRRLRRVHLQWHRVRQLALAADALIVRFFGRKPLFGFSRRGNSSTHSSSFRLLTVSAATARLIQSAAPHISQNLPKRDLSSLFTRTRAVAVQPGLQFGHGEFLLNRRRLTQILRLVARLMPPSAKPLFFELGDHGHGGFGKGTSPKSWLGA